MSATTRGLGTRMGQTARRLLGEWRYSLGVVARLAVGLGPAAVGLTVMDRVLLRALRFDEYRIS